MKTHDLAPARPFSLTVVSRRIMQSSLGMTVLWLISNGQLPCPKDRHDRASPGDRAPTIVNGVHCEIRHKRIGRHAPLALGQMLDILIDRTISERHKVRVSDLRDLRNQVARLHNDDFEACRVQTEHGEIAESRGKAGALRSGRPITPRTSTTACLSRGLSVGSRKTTFAKTSTGLLASGSSAPPILRGSELPTPAR